MGKKIYLSLGVYSTYGLCCQWDHMNLHPLEVAFEKKKGGRKHEQRLH